MIDTEVQPGPEAGTGNDDVRADVLAAIEQLKGPEIEPEKATDPAAATVDDPTPSERLRNERGQFIKADGTVDEAAEAARTVPDADQKQEQVAEPSKANDPPSFLSADAKAEWARTPSAVQAALIKRDVDANEGGRRWSEEKRTYDDMLTPVREQAQRAGVDEREGLNRLLAANDFLERDPENAIRWLAQAYKVDLSKPNGNTAPQPQADPQFAQLHNEVRSLKTAIQSREQAETQTALQQFATAPGHEHFESVKVKMGHLLKAGQATDLQDAYDQAVWANPTTRQTLLSAQTAAATKTAQERAQTDKARRGAISTNGSPVADTAAAPKKEFETVREAAEAAYRQHAGG